jgi:hypothetical protein
LSTLRLTVGHAPQAVVARLVVARHRRRGRPRGPCRGRLVLPFADHDPRTAEVMSKLLLLARARGIRDPNILHWMRAGQGAFSKY